MRLKKVIAVIRGRLVRNIIFWGYFLWKRLLFPIDSAIMPHYQYYGLVIFNLSFFALASYVNNLVLVPRFLAKKKYFLHIVFAVALVFSVSLLYTLVLKYEYVHFPQVKIFSVSIVTSPMTMELSLGAAYREMGSVHAVMMAVVVGFTGSWYVNAYSKKEKLMEEVVKKQIETELNFLKSQLNPHFLFNTLNNLYGLTLKKSDDAPEAILKLSSILRYILYESNVPLIPFDKEKDIMQAYIDIEMLRVHDNKDITFTIMSDHDISIPPLLWLPVLENVFKHGTTIMSDSSYIDFRFTIHDDTLHMFSKNNFKADKQYHNLEKIGGIGMSNLTKRLELLYPGRHNIQAKPEGEYYIVNVQITLV